MYMIYLIILIQNYTAETASVVHLAAVKPQDRRNMPGTADRLMYPAGQDTHEQWYSEPDSGAGGRCGAQAMRSARADSEDFGLAR